jgi:hypothetical protein
VVEYLYVCTRLRGGIEREVVGGLVDKWCAFYGRHQAVVKRTSTGIVCVCVRERERKKSTMTLRVATVSTLILYTTFATNENFIGIAQKRGWKQYI